MNEFKLAQVKKLLGPSYFYGVNASPNTNTNVPEWMYLHVAFPANNVQRLYDPATACICSVGRKNYIHNVVSSVTRIPHLPLQWKL